jgi:outer membrane protein assembly factor BamB
MLSRVLVLALAVPLAARAGDWPMFRGGPRGGVAEAKTLPVTWDAKKNVVWSANIPGRGWSSPVVWGQRVFVTTVVSAGKDKPPKKGLYIDDLRGKLSTEEHRWLVCCLDFATGKVLWQKEVHRGKPPAPIHVKNTYASSTPAVDAGRVYAYFGNVGVFCLDHKGELLWSKKLDAKPTQMEWGPAASPTLYQDRLFVINDNEKDSYLLALDAKSGKELWRKSRKEKSNWATPFVWENKERTELVTPGKGKVRSYGLDGRLLWELGGMSVLTIPTPSARDGLLYVSSGYVLDANRPVYAIRPGAAGDITLPKDRTSSKYVVWKQKQAGPYHPSPVVYGDYVYVLLDRGFLSCYDAKTGKAVYEKKRLEGGSAFTASPWAYGGKVFCLSEDGDTFVVKAGKDFELLGKNRLEEMTLATPALANGSLIVRTMTKLYRIEEK